MFPTSAKPTNAKRHEKPIDATNTTQQTTKDIFDILMLGKGGKPQMASGTLWACQLTLPHIWFFHRDSLSRDRFFYLKTRFSPHRPPKSWSCAPSSFNTIRKASSWRQLRFLFLTPFCESAAHFWTGASKDYMVSLQSENIRWALAFASSAVILAGGFSCPKFLEWRITLESRSLLKTATKLPHALTAKQTWLMQSRSTNPTKKVEAS